MSDVYAGNRQRNYVREKGSKGTAEYSSPSSALCKLGRTKAPVMPRGLYSNSNV